MRLRQITQTLALFAVIAMWSAMPANAQLWPSGNQNQVSQQGQLSMTQPPIIEYADPHTVTVMWQTDQNATGVLRWGADPNNLTQGSQQDDRSRTHRIRVMNQFQPGSTYYFQVASQSNNGQVVSPMMSFTTPSNGVVRQQQPNVVGGAYDQNAQGSYGQGPYGQPNGGYGLPQNSGPVAAGNSQITQGPIVEYADQHSATIMFQTAGDTNGGINVRFGNDPNNLTQVARVGGYGNPYRVQILNAFQPGQTYYFQIVSRGQALSPVFSFRTSSEKKPIRQQQPQQVSAASGNTGYGNGGYSNAPYGSAYPQGGYGQYGQQTGPQDVRIMQDPVVRAQGADSAVVTWRTNAPSSAVVHYGADPNNLSQTATAPWGGTVHRVVITNLQPGTQYYIQVESGQGQGTGTGTMSNVVQFQAGTYSNWPR